MGNRYYHEKVINACNRKGFHVIAAVKTNRLICVGGVTISMADFAVQYLRKSDLRSVTVESQGTYWIYEYEGPLSEMENVKALLSWKDEYADSSKPQVCLLCTDLSLDLVTIQRYYHVRWNIETGYRYFKEFTPLLFPARQPMKYLEGTLGFIGKMPCRPIRFPGRSVFKIVSIYCHKNISLINFWHLYNLVGGLIRYPKS